MALRKLFRIYQHIRKERRQTVRRLEQAWKKLNSEDMRNLLDVEDKGDYIKITVKPNTPVEKFYIIYGAIQELNGTLVDNYFFIPIPNVLFFVANEK